MCLLSFISTCHFCFIQKIIYYLKEIGLVLVSQSSAVVTFTSSLLVKFSNRVIQNLFSFPQRTSIKKLAKQSGIIVSMFLHSLLVDQLYAKGVYFCNFVTKPNQACIKYSPKYILQFLLDALSLKTPTAFSHISLQKLFLLFPPHVLFIRTLQAPFKKVTRFQQVLKSLFIRYFSASDKIPFFPTLEPF